MYLLDLYVMYIHNILKIYYKKLENLYAYICRFFGKNCLLVLDLDALTFQRNHQQNQEVHPTASLLLSR